MKGEILTMFNFVRKYKMYRHAYNSLLFIDKMLQEKMYENSKFITDDLYTLGKKFELVTIAKVVSSLVEDLEI